MARVTSGEFQREFGRYCAVAQREAVIITKHGRDDLVLLAADEYARLRRHARMALHVSELSDEVIDELGTVEVAEEASKDDHEHKP